jgi:putative transposase
MSSERNETEAKIFLTKLKNGLETKPKYIHTDNSFDYPPAIRKIFGRGKVKHIHFPAWKMKFRNNAIERYHNTIRENYKVMRRFCNLKSAYRFLEFFRDYYNFIRPHKTLNWQTPAQIAGFGKWNWWTLIRDNEVM